MNKLRRFAIAALAAATVTIGSVASTPTASAMEMSCAQRETIAVAYWGYGMPCYNIGQTQWAAYWWGKADGLMVGC